jgi:(p)ppGpp synthase/HD superfamily hydrolase
VNAADLYIAVDIARRAHMYQTEKFSGQPYFNHLNRVSHLVAGNWRQEAIAWLHDILEDTDTSVNDLKEAGISDDIIASVTRLTHVHGVTSNQTYHQNIRTIIESGDEDAIAVKTADILDHLRPMDTPLPRSMRERYLKALTMLMAHYDEISE